MLHNIITRDLEQRIRNGEQRHRQRITVWRQPRDLEHIIVRLGVEDSCIADVA